MPGKKEFDCDITYEPVMQKKFLTFRNKTKKLAVYCIFYLRKYVLKPTK